MSADVVTLARGWLGTPYHHRACTRGAGADCLGLIRGVWIGLYGAEPQPLPHYAPGWADCGADLLAQALARHFALQTKPADGQVLLFRLQPRARPRHLGIQTQGGRAFIHACPRAGVVEAPLSAPWARRVTARFAFPTRMTELE